MTKSLGYESFKNVYITAESKQKRIDIEETCSLPHGPPSILSRQV